MSNLDEWLERELPGLVEVRRNIHAHPELGFEEVRTSRLVADRLQSCGFEVTEGVGRTGVVGTIRGRLPGQRAIGLRADMDALPIHEATGLPYASCTPGRMHACGHDGHTAMLLGAAQYMAGHLDEFGGIVHVIFQPAEEGRRGALAMLEDGLFDRFPCDAIYGLHNSPGIAAGEFATRVGPMMAAADTYMVKFQGAGGHGGTAPHLTNDITYAQAHFVLGLQGIVGRNVPPRDTAVISVGYIGAGSAEAPSVVPAELTIAGTTRCYAENVRALLERRIREVAMAIAAAWACEVEVTYERGPSAVVNHPETCNAAIAAAESVAGIGRVDCDIPLSTGGEDFADLMRARPGAFMRIGNGIVPEKGGNGLHTPTYDFSDEVIPDGVKYWIALVRQELGNRGPLGVKARHAL